MLFNIKRKWLFSKLIGTSNRTVRIDIDMFLLLVNLKAHWRLLHNGDLFGVCDTKTKQMRKGPEAIHPTTSTKSESIL